MMFLILLKVETEYTGSTVTVLKHLSSCLFSSAQFQKAQAAFDHIKVVLLVMSEHHTYTGHGRCT